MAAPVCLQHTLPFAKYFHVGFLSEVLLLPCEDKHLLSSLWKEETEAQRV